MSPNVERASVLNAEEILALQELAYQSEAVSHGDDDIPPLVQTLEKMEADFDRQTVLKATIGSKIAGSARAFARDATCHIGRLIVDPNFQNRGLGTWLMNEI